MIELARLRIFFSNFTDLPDSEWAQFSNAVKVKKIQKNENFISIGGDSGNIGFVLKGLFRVSYFDVAGLKSIRNFCAEDSLISTYTAALNNRPAEAEIQAIENSMVLFFNYADFKACLSRHICWQNLGRQIAEKYFSFRESREHQFLTLDAAERHQAFLENFGHLKDRISNADAAAYIGITPSSLSRILNEKK